MSAVRALPVALVCFLISAAVLFPFVSSAATDSSGGKEDAEKECGLKNEAGTAKSTKGEALSGGQKTHHVVAVDKNGNVTVTCIPLTEAEKRAGKQPQTWYRDLAGEFINIAPGSVADKGMGHIINMMRESGTPTAPLGASFAQASMGSDAFTQKLLGVTRSSDLIRDAFGPDTTDSLPPIKYDMQWVTDRALFDALNGSGDYDQIPGASSVKTDRFDFAENFAQGYTYGVRGYGRIPMEQELGLSDYVFPDGTVAKGGPVVRSKDISGMTIDTWNQLYAQSPRQDNTFPPETSSIAPIYPNSEPNFGGNSTGIPHGSDVTDPVRGKTNTQSGRAPLIIRPDAHPNVYERAKKFASDFYSWLDGWLP